MSFIVSQVRLSHFSETPDIGLFEPQPVRVPVDRPMGQEWLNGPLVWAIDKPHSILYLFPRECPRILLWPTTETTPDDRHRWLGSSTVSAVAYVEDRWLDRIEHATIYRYDMPATTFEPVGDVGMWVSRTAVRPAVCDKIEDLPNQLVAAGVELRAQHSLIDLKPIWNSSLHASGIRLRNAADWRAPGWPHSKRTGKLSDDRTINDGFTTAET